jgi:hypothetical protein
MHTEFYLGNLLENVRRLVLRMGGGYNWLRVVSIRSEPSGYTYR